MLNNTITNFMIVTNARTSKRKAKIITIISFNLFIFSPFNATLTNVLLMLYSIYDGSSIKYQD